MFRAYREAASVRAVEIIAGSARLHGDLTLPSAATGVVLFAHGSGSSRKSSRNQFVASQLNAGGLATLLLDLLTETEELIDRIDARLRFDVSLLANRLIGATDWLASDPNLSRLPAGYFGASTGAAAALIAGAERPGRVQAIVSRGGRPDLAGEALAAVAAPTLLIVGGNDERVIPLNESALDRLGSQTKKLVIVPGATHLFEEPGALEEVARLAADWFGRYLTTDSVGG
jgi:pimeloyl-ACP methyl ester carboxylesterase